MKQWEVVIGIETHAQLSTCSKIFSGSSTAFGAAPNLQANAVDIALPGVLPVLNKGAVDCAIRFGLAVGAQIAARSVFARKNYFYPDLPKGYQISQYELPVVVGGKLVIAVGDHEKTVHLTRAHLEEDAGKSLHEGSGQSFQGKSGIDLNRAGTPLLEIVTEPDLRSAAEAVAYARALHALVRWIGICDGNMQEGSFRCDANVSVRPCGQAHFGTRREIKNLNSFRFMQQAIDYEVQWQIATLEDGGRSNRRPCSSIRRRAKRGPCARRRTRTITATSPTPTCCRCSLTGRGSSRFVPGCPSCRSAARAAARRLRAVALRRQGPHQFARTCGLLRSGGRHCRQGQRQDLRQLGDGRPDGAAQQAGARDWRIPALGSPARWPAGAHWRWHDLDQYRPPGLRYPLEWRGSSADEIIAGQGLQQITDSESLDTLIDELLAANPTMVAEFRAGKEKAFNALVGQAMKATRGKANPQRVSELLRKRLG
jgi:aspartyl-tRNA(Asn)/glutamyl-tRNA(Gln) amidotransferase subunit B